MLIELLQVTKDNVAALDPFIAGSVDTETRDTLRVVQAQGRGICEVIERAVQATEVNGGVVPMAELTASVGKFNGAVSKFLASAGRV